MEDRELLERAAKAAEQDGRYMEWHHPSAGCGIVYSMGHKPWNPLIDDGDALRLAVKLRIDLLMDGFHIESPSVEAVVNTGADAQPFAIEALDTGDPCAATRRAIVRAAAAMADA